MLKKQSDKEKIANLVENKARRSTVKEDDLTYSQSLLEAKKEEKK